MNLSKCYICGKKVRPITLEDFKEGRQIPKPQFISFMEEIDICVNCFLEFIRWLLDKFKRDRGIVMT